MIAVEERRKNAALAAAKLPQRGQAVGLGTGRTAAVFVEALAARAAAEQLGLVCVATSEKTAALARERGLVVKEPDELASLDIAIDGADEVDPELDLVKGLGGALLRERLVERTAKRLVIVVDDEKLVRALGRGKVPVEIVPFGAKVTIARLEALGATAELRGGWSAPFRTDQGNWIADLTFAKLDKRRHADAIKATAGVVDHGLFLGMATELIVGRADGSIATSNRDLP